jgi:hypothetical protein
MKFLSSARCVIALAVLAALPLNGLAGPKVLAVGDQMEAFSLSDQNGKTHELDSSVRVILFSRDRAGGGVMTRSMEGRDGDFLAERGVVYVNDISKMPRAAAALFALPKMRRRGYPILLDRDENATAHLPDKIRFATLIHLDALKISEIEYVEDDQALAKRLEALPKND